MQAIIECSRGAQKGILPAFRMWLQKFHKQLYNVADSLRLLLELRNRASHEGLIENSMERAHMACRTIVENIHNPNRADTSMHP